MRFHPQELIACGLNEDAFLEHLSVLKVHVGSAVTAPIESRQRLDISTILRACTCAAAIRALASVLGFHDVAKQIRTSSEASIWEPHGAWFHLVTAYILRAGGCEVLLEHPLEGTPRDIYVPSANAALECKSFGRGGRQDDRLRRFLNRQNVEDDDPELPPAFNTGFLFWPPIPGLPNRWTLTNNFPRFFSNALSEKNRQLVPDLCNLIAVRTNNVSRKLGALREPLADLLKTGQFTRVSGFLLVEENPLSREDQRFQSERFSVLLVESEHPEAVPVPGELKNSIQLWSRGSGYLCPKA